MGAIEAHSKSVLDGANAIAGACESIAESINALAEAIDRSASRSVQVDPEPPTFDLDAEIPLTSV